MGSICRQRVRTCEGTAATGPSPILTLIVNPKINTTTTASNAAATYGAASATLNATVTPASGPTVGAGTVTFTIKSGLTTVGSVTSATVSANAASATFALTGVNAGTYTIEAAYSGSAGHNASNNSAQSPTPTLTIGKKTLTVSATDQSKTYGSANPAFGFSYSGGFIGTDTAAGIDTPPTCSSTATTTTPVGTAPITCSGGVDNNYAFSYVAGTLTIGKKTLTVTATDQSKTYGSANPAFGFSYSGGFVGTDTAAGIDTPPTCSSTATTATPVGTAPITCSGGVDNNYAFSYVAGTLTIGKKTLTVSATDQSKTYGSLFVFDTTSPSAHFTVVGLVNGDTVTDVTLSSTGAAATATVGGSPYPILISGALGTGLSNYDITYENAELTVDPKALTVSATDQSKTYGSLFVFDTTSPSAHFTVVGLVNGDTVTDVTLSSTGAAATATVGGSPYPIRISGALGPACPTTTSPTRTPS